MSKPLTKEEFIKAEIEKMQKELRDKAEAKWKEEQKLEKLKSIHETLGYDKEDARKFAEDFHKAHGLRFGKDGKAAPTKGSGSRTSPGELTQEEKDGIKALWEKNNKIDAKTVKKTYAKADGRRINKFLNELNTPAFDEALEKAKPKTAIPNAR